MRKILIPTDFTVESLQLIEYAILNFPDTKLEIILIAGYRLPDARWEIMHFREGEQIRKQLSDDFKDTLRRIKSEHKNIIEAVSFELFTGFNSFAFRNFLEQLDAEDAIVPRNKTLCYASNKWFDTTRFIKTNVKNAIEVPVELKKEVSQGQFSLVSIFNL